MVGDVTGRSGRRAFVNHTQKLKSEKNIDVVIVNGENIAHGKGISQSTFMEILSGGADVVTSGNHIWDNKDVFKIIDREPFLIRPANYPEDVPGKGYCIYPYRAKNIGVMNLSGRTFMPPIDCPFMKASEILRELKKNCDVIVLDFHAEATSEKMAMGYYLDGEVSAVVGTHTHVQTADEKILPKGTAYITDLGMVGVKDSILGVDPEPVLKKFLTGMPTKFEITERSACIYCGLLITIDDKTNKVIEVERIFDHVD